MLPLMTSLEQLLFTPSCSIPNLWTRKPYHLLSWLNRRMTHSSFIVKEKARISIRKSFFYHWFWCNMCITVIQRKLLSKASSSLDCTAQSLFILSGKYLSVKNSKTHLTLHRFLQLSVTYGGASARTPSDWKQFVIWHIKLAKNQSRSENDWLVNPV